MQHCTDLPRQVAFLAHTKPGKMGPCRVGINVTAHQNKEKNEETRTGKKGAGEKENRRPILGKLCAALLRSFRGSIAKK